MGKTRKWIKWSILLLILFILGLLLVYFLRYLLAEEMSLWQAERYKVQGVDVSYYQGEIDWSVLAPQIDFAFIKATEGSSHMDRCFPENRDNALENWVPVGAYHFFSFESSGETQAENYIRVVGKWDGMLRPVVDVEYYSVENDLSDNSLLNQQTISMDYVRQELQIMLDCLEEYYGVKPIIYATMTSYYEILGGEFEEYPLWIRNTYFEPMITAGDWTFWQYCDEGMLEGYSGEEEYIDLNVFYGTEEELREYRIWME